MRYVCNTEIMQAEIGAREILDIRVFKEDWFGSTMKGRLKRQDYIEETKWLLNQIDYSHISFLLFYGVFCEELTVLLKYLKVTCSLEG